MAAPRCYVGTGAAILRIRSVPYTRRNSVSSEQEFGMCHRPLPQGRGQADGEEDFTNQLGARFCRELLQVWRRNLSDTTPTRRLHLVNEEECGRRRVWKVWPSKVMLDVKGLGENSKG